jgi:hypothetical protein
MSERQRANRRIAFEVDDSGTRFGGVEVRVLVDG